MNNVKITVIRCNAMMTLLKTHKPTQYSQMTYLILFEFYMMPPILEIRIERNKR